MARRIDEDDMVMEYLCPHFKLACDSITHILNMPGSSRSSLTLETEEENLQVILSQKEENLCHMPVSKTKDDEIYLLQVP
ncbi:hypothetical protein EVAR_67912_1 [Eumeta japonica]|uniref:Uncharacterized protein n=1 Tax=Eumeta variegata TaxID=151549 RepID=A0A4C1SYJ4_EUMVA|nr:hypothetical protein EVAR_67912_1 [Eumeta japonica]